MTEEALAFMPEPTRDDNFNFRGSAMCGDYTAVEQYIKKFGSRWIDTADAAGNTALFYAATGNFTNILQLLLENGADIKHTNRAGLNVTAFALRENAIYSYAFLYHWPHEQQQKKELLEQKAQEKMAQENLSEQRIQCLKQRASRITFKNKM